MYFLFPLHSALFPKIDVNGDTKISPKELYEWIEAHMKEHVILGVDMRIRDMDKNGDGKVSWEEYEAVEYDPRAERGEIEKQLKRFTQITTTI